MPNISWAEIPEIMMSAPFSYCFGAPPHRNNPTDLGWGLIRELFFVAFTQD